MSSPPSLNGAFYSQSWMTELRCRSPFHQRWRSLEVKNLPESHCQWVSKLGLEPSS